jgi:Tfp pilus assembly protein PilN
MSSSQKINLIPASRRQHRLIRRALRNWIALGSSYALVVALLVATYASTGARDYQAMSAELSDVQSSAKTAQNSVNALKRQLADATQRQVVAEEVRTRPDWSLLLVCLGREVGSDVVLREVQVSPLNRTSRDNLPKDLQVFGTGCYTVSIKGVGLSQQAVSQFTLRLQDLGLFESVQMVRSGREPLGNVTGIGFDLQCQLAPAEVRK